MATAGPDRNAKTAVSQQRSQGLWGSGAFGRATGWLLAVLFLVVPTAAEASAATLRQTAQSQGDAAVIRVGPEHALKRPSDAAAIAGDGAVVEIDAGTYSGDVAIWRQNRLTLRGVGGLAMLDADGRSAQGKAIWVIKGDDVTVERIGFVGCRVPDRNGAGIRAEGRNLTIRGSLFHDNEMGILTSNVADSHIVIESSEFSRNKSDTASHGRLGHNIYIGQVASFTLRASYVHGGQTGHNVKTRARVNRILYNRIVDHDDTGSSYLIDLAEGGEAVILGNSLRQSEMTENRAMIAYAAEGGKRDADAKVAVVNNTFVSDRASVRFVRNFGAASVGFYNNLLVGGTRLVSGRSRLAGNVIATAESLAAPQDFDYRLTAGSPAIDAGRDFQGDESPLLALQVYRHPSALRPRPRDGALDAGAYEFEAP